MRTWWMFLEGNFLQQEWIESFRGINVFNLQVKVKKVLNKKKEVKI